MKDNKGKIIDIEVLFKPHIIPHFLESGKAIYEFRGISKTAKSLIIRTIKAELDEYIKREVKK